jgi:putative Mg2+ transporter-C (MgtC) family protein
MDKLTHVAQVIGSEFADIQDLEQLTRVSLRLLLAALLGAILGIEREHAGKAAGVRTHMLVSMGGALFVLGPLQSGMEPEDLSRVIQGVVAGVGFLCAGTILKTRSEGDVQGLTTAAGLWMTAAIGVSAGMGREATAVLSALLAFIVLALERPLRRLIRGKQDEDGAPRTHQ